MMLMKMTIPNGCKGIWHVVLFTFVSGYRVEKGTVIFINNYEINNNEKYWHAPSEFRPERFIVDGKVTRPEYLIPFSTGKRTFIGQHIVQCNSFLLVSTILQHFDVPADPSSIRTYPACIAVPPDTFSLAFTPRNVNSVHSS
jgi:cytochrome P450 family 307 subfamily A